MDYFLSLYYWRTVLLQQKAEKTRFDAADARRRGTRKKDTKNNTWKDMEANIGIPAQIAFKM